MTGTGADYGQSAEIDGILDRFNSVGVYGHILIGNNKVVGNRNGRARAVTEAKG